MNKRRSQSSRKRERECMLRYQSQGEVHKDFHRLTCATLHYLKDHFGSSAMEEVLKNTAQKVYKTIHKNLKDGNCEELIEFWTYYLKRENGEFTLTRGEDEIRLIVKKCPALHHLVELGQAPDQILCDATRIFNDALTEGTPYHLSTEQIGEFSCIQTLKRRKK